MLNGRHGMRFRSFRKVSVRRETARHGLTLRETMFTGNVSVRATQSGLSSMVGRGLPCSLVGVRWCASFHVCMYVCSRYGNEEKLLVTDQKHSSEPNCRVLGLSTQHSSCMTACGVTCIANSTLAIHHKPVCVRTYVCVCMCVCVSACM